MDERIEGQLERAAEVRLYYCNWLPQAHDDQLAARGGTWAAGHPNPAGSLLSAGHPNPAGPLLIVMHGYGEHCRRYDEFAEALLARGIGVCRCDARGHGRSSGQRGYVRRFEDYVDDLAAFVEQLAATYPERPLALLGHSNGGLIAARAVERGLPRVRALALTSPLFVLPRARRPVPDGVARLLSAVLGRLPLPNGIRSADLTHDAALQAAHAADDWVHGRATPRWYWSMTLAGRAALEDARRVKLPLLSVLGERDVVVDTDAVRAFHERAGSSDKELLERRGALHEVLNETDRAELFQHIADWLRRVCG